MVERLGVERAVRDHAADAVPDQLALVAITVAMLATR
jgi:hypothetical protein